MPNFVALPLLAAFGIAWGLTLPLTKVAVSTGHHPFGLIFWQVVIVALALLPLFLRLGRLPRTDRKALLYYAVIGVFGTVIPNGISYFCYTKLPAGIMSILISTIPMFTFAMALALGSDRFSMRRFAGILCGAIAVALLVGPQASLPERGAAIFVLVGLLPSICYALEGNYVSNYAPPGIDAIEALFGASIVSAIVLLPLATGFGVFIDPRLPWGNPEWALIASSLLHTMAYCGYIWLLAHVGAVFASQTSYIVTFTGVAASAFFLNESYANTVWLAAAIMIVGLFLVQTRRKAADKLAVGA